MAGINVTIRNSRFTNCNADAIYIRGDFGPIRNFLIENNFFDFTSTAPFSVRLSGPTSPNPCENVLVRYNSSLQRMWSDCPAAGTNGIRFTSNVNYEQDNYHCSTSMQQGATWDHNVYETGIPCGRGDVVGPVYYKDRANLDLHLLPGSTAFDRGDPSSFPATDIDGQSRPMGAGPDAGADEAG
jgi:hypothetical protein